MLSSVKRVWVDGDGVWHEQDVDLEDMFIDPAAYLAAMKADLPMIEHLTDPEFIAAMSDKDLLAAYQRTDGESAEAGALLSEIERRNLDI